VQRLLHDACEPHIAGYGVDDDFAAMSGGEDAGRTQFPPALHSAATSQGASLMSLSSLMRAFPPTPCDICHDCDSSHAARTFAGEGGGDTTPLRRTQNTRTLRAGVEGAELARQVSEISSTVPPALQQGSCSALGMPPCHVCLLNLKDTTSTERLDECAFLGRRLENGLGLASGVGRPIGPRALPSRNPELETARDLIRLAGRPLLAVLRRELELMQGRQIWVLSPIGDSGRAVCDVCKGSLLSLRCGRLVARPAHAWKGPGHGKQPHGSGFAGLSATDAGAKSASRARAGGGAHRRVPAVVRVGPEATDGPCVCVCVCLGGGGGSTLRVDAHLGRDLTLGVRRANEYVRPRC
jgi:hypothetical protein